MAKIIKNNPFVARLGTRSRNIRLPGGIGSPLHLTDSIGIQFSDYRIGDVVVPFMFIGSTLSTGEVRLNFLDGEKQQFRVSDSVHRVALQMGKELHEYFIECYPDHEIEVEVTDRGVDPIPRFKDPNDDPWMEFVSCSPVERVETEIGELAVGANNIFDIRVGCGSARGTPAVILNGLSITFRHDYAVNSGRIEFIESPWSPRPSAFIDQGRPNYAELGTIEAMHAHPPSKEASREICDTTARISAQVASEFLTRRFEDIRDSAIELVAARRDRSGQSLEIIQRALASAGGKLFDFMAARAERREMEHSQYNRMVVDLTSLSVPEDAIMIDINAPESYLGLDGIPRYRTGR